MKTIFSIMIIAFTVTTFSAEPIKVDSKIVHATVFLSGAQVTRTAEYQLNAGKTQLKFSDISPDIDESSLQVEGDGDFTVLSVVYQKNFLNEQTKSVEIKGLEERKETLKDKLQSAQNMINVYNQEQGLILANKSIGGNLKGVEIKELKATADFYRQRLAEINKAKFDISEEMQANNEEHKKIEKQLTELHVVRNLATSEIVVTISAKRSVKGKFKISYLVQKAGWYPTYDLRVKDVSNPIKLMYKANVTQLSGEDWVNVKLTLSTGNPTQSGTKPTLKPWRLAYSYPSYDKGRRLGKRSSTTGWDYKVNGGLEKMEERNEKKDYASKPLAATQSDNSTSINFNIEIPYTVLNDGKEYKVEMQEFELPATYEYYVAPKLDTDAFLTAKITDWEQYNLLEGEVNLFFEGKFLGKSLLDTRSVRDTLEMSLGRDNNIVVTREKSKEFSKKKFFGSNKTESVAWDITIRNKKKQAIHIIIEDQLPISTDKNIKVFDTEVKPKVKVDETSQIVRWEFDIQSQGSEKMELKYSVKYPKKKQVLVE